MSASYQLSCASSLLLLAVLAVLLPSASSTGVVNGYCNGYGSNLTCSIANLQSHSGIINSLAISSYHLSPTGLVIPCAKGDRDCPFPGDVEEYNARVAREVPGMLVVPLVFDNDGKTVEQTRAMWSNGYAAANIATLVNRTLQYNYSGLSMDWEPSCWMDQPSKCSWPTVEEAQAYTGFLTNLSAAFVAADRVLTICADHEVCEPDVDCGGDDYIKHCLADEYSMSWCNCCAFHTWSPHPLTHRLVRIAGICGCLHESVQSTHCRCNCLCCVCLCRFNATALCNIPTKPMIAVMVRRASSHTPRSQHSPTQVCTCHPYILIVLCCVVVALCRTRTVTIIHSTRPTWTRPCSHGSMPAARPTACHSACCRTRR